MRMQWARPAFIAAAAPLSGVFSRSPFLGIEEAPAVTPPSGAVPRPLRLLMEQDEKTSCPGPTLVYL